jgi:hypothetical protein
MIDSVEKSMLAKTDEVLLSLQRDYRFALIGAQWAAGDALPREQRVARRDVLEVLRESEKIFKELAGCGPEEGELGPTDACDESWTSNVQERLGSLSVKAESDSRSDMDVDEAPVTSTPGMQLGGGFQCSFRQKTKVKNILLALVNILLTSGICSPSNLLLTHLRALLRSLALMITAQGIRQIRTLFL